MSLFQVPGWAVAAAPVQESKKRKRKANGQSEDAEFQDLVAQIQKITPPDLPTKKKRRKADKPKKDATPVVTADPAPQKVGDAVGAKSETKKERKKQKQAPKPAPSNPTSPQKQKSPPKQKQSPAAPKPTPAAILTPLQKQMKGSLDGARFRVINEELYKSDSKAAVKMMREDPSVFEAYHVGFRHQVLSWPKNPVDHFISKLSTYSKQTVIADLGCGDAALAKAMLPKGFTVLSYDLVSNNGYVVEADICRALPLPGSEPDAKATEATSGEGQVVNAVVCALSLMGVNWPQCIREAWRVLKAGGELHIAEVTSRFVDVEQFQDLVSSLGFQLKNTDFANSHFSLFEFVKEPRKGLKQAEWDKILKQSTLLKPCEYKRR